MSKIIKIFDILNLKRNDISIWIRDVSKIACFFDILFKDNRERKNALVGCRNFVTNKWKLNLLLD